MKGSRPLRGSSKPMRRSVFKQRVKSIAKELSGGREKLTGIFYKARCEQVWGRDGGRCQMPSEWTIHNFAFVNHPWGEPSALQWAVFYEQGFSPYEICGEYVPLNRSQFDHIVKRSHGRDDRIENLRLSSERCHRKRHELERISK
jgi:HNH endonuclease